MRPILLETAEEVAQSYAALPGVEAVVLGGSAAAGGGDAQSDIDLYVYLDDDLPRRSRAAIAIARAESAEIDNRFWEPGDEWVEMDSRIHVDVMFRATQWIEAQLHRVLTHHQASVGYSTCFWFNVQTSLPLFDARGWFAGLQDFARMEYPEPLRRAIIAKNQPILRATQSAYTVQLEKAIVRRDLVSVNHRITALLTSYFDCLFALNRQPHPGEKRLLSLASDLCPLRPEGMVSQVEKLVRGAAVCDRQLLSRANELVDGLEQLLLDEGLLSARRSP